MNVEIVKQNGKKVAVVEAQDLIITDLQSAMDLMPALWSEPECRAIVIAKEAVTEAFFDLRTGLAGEILQKFINYQIRFAVYGDFSSYTSHALRDFIYECNQGKDICFAASREEAVARLLGA